MLNIISKYPSFGQVISWIWLYLVLFLAILPAGNSYGGSEEGPYLSDIINANGYEVATATIKNVPKCPTNVVVTVTYMDALCEAKTFTYEYTLESGHNGSSLNGEYFLMYDIEVETFHTLEFFESLYSDPEQAALEFYDATNNHYWSSATINSIQVVNEGCSSCSAGSGGADLSCLRLRINMGNGADGKPLGYLRLQSELPTPNLAKPDMLSFSNPKAQVIRQAGVIRQIKGPYVFADIVTSSTSVGYEVRIYSAVNSGTMSQTTGLYEPTGVPEKIWAVENPDGDIANPNAPLTRLKATEIQGSQASVNLFEYTASTNTWSLSKGTDGERKEYKSDVWDAEHLNHTITHTVCDASETVVYKKQDFYYAFPWGEDLVKTVEDPDGAALTTTYSYYDNSAVTGSYSNRKEMVTPTGHWEHYYYDSDGRIIKTVTQFESSAVDSAESLNRVSTTSYRDYEPQETHIEKVQDREVARSYIVYRHASPTSDLIALNIQCQSPGATYTAADNLITTTVTDSSGGDFDGKIKSVTTPDGAVTQYLYQTNTDGSTTETVIQPNGIQTITTSASNGNVTSIVTKAQDLLISSASNVEFDETGRVTRTEYEDGTYETTAFGCCGADVKRDRRGIVTSYSYDSLKQVKTETSEGITLIYDYDANGNRIKTTRQGTDGSQIVINQSFYDVAGRLWKTVDAANNPTFYSQTKDAQGNTLKTTIYPNNETRIETYYQDGQLLSVAGSAVQPVKYEYGADDVGGFFAKEIRPGDNGEETEWNTTWTGLNGKVAKVTHSGAPEATTNYFYNAKGQLTREVDADGVTTLYAYNQTSGEREITAVDMDRNGVIDFSGTDRITKVVSSIVSGSAGFGLNRTTTTTWNKDNNDTCIESIVQSTSGGLETWLTQSGLTTHTVTVIGTDGSRTITTTYPDSSSAIQIYGGSRVLSQTRFDSTGSQISSQTYNYDAHGRQDKVIDARNGETSLTYYDTGLVHTTTTPAPDDGSSAQTTTYEYDPMGRKTIETQPDNGVVNYQYYPTGALKHTDGARVYTADYTYDAQGRMRTLATATGTTTWAYYPDSGLLHTKTYPGGNGTTYTYTPGGRLLTRTWARGIVTTYGHNNAGETDSITYSDSTPAITLHYNRLGKLDLATDNSGSHTLSYNDGGQQDTETFTAGLFAGFSLVNSYDSYFRRDGFTVNTGTTALISQGYSYDNASRLQTATQGSVAGTYIYEANSTLISTVAVQNNGSTVSTGKTYDALNRLKTISAGVGSRTVSSYGYSYNSANQRTRVDLADGSYVAYEYDTLGQVTSGKRYWSGGVPATGQQYDYQFDGIGNRLSTTVNGRETGYTPNALNQYANREIASVLDILGNAAPSATVTVNDKAVTRQQGGYFAGEVNVNNSTEPVYVPIRIVGVKAGAGADGKDIVTTSSGNLFVAKTPESFFYDLDGNLTSDGRWNYTWDGENRLIAMEARSEVPAAAKKKLIFSYDYQGRRVEKAVYLWNAATSSYEASATECARFLYDGWNLVAELNASNAITRSYLWGVDLSNTAQQGAGGVGGLLAVTTSGTNAGSYIYAYDGNGNVSDLVNEVGASVAHYEYGPFGEPVRVSGAMAGQNPFRFSTKYTDDETGLLYYGYRYYNPSTGRWINRDPIGENGGENLYGFCLNNPLLYIDPDGYSPMGPSPSPMPPTPVPSIPNPYAPKPSPLPGPGPGNNNGGVSFAVGWGGGHNSIRDMVDRTAFLY